MPEFRHRTAEEREAARRERERKRAQSRGTPAQEADLAPLEPAPGSSVVPEHDPRLPDDEAEHDPRLPDEEEPEHDPRLPDEDEADVLTPFETGELELPAATQAAGETASGTRRVGWREARAQRGSGDGGPPRPRRGHHQPRRQNREPRERHFHAPHSWLGRGIAVVALLLAAAIIWFCVELFQPLHGAGHGEVTVTIPPHASTSQIASQLSREGVVSSSFFFELRAKLDGSKLLAGTYHLPLDAPYGDVIKTLSTPPPPVKTTEVTIDPGRTRTQIDHLLRSQAVKGSYLAATRRSPLLNPRTYGAPPGTPSLEGFLSPDTYQLRVPINIDDLVADQLRSFKQKFARVNLGYARAHHVTPYQVLIVASMVEAEAETEHDRPLIASVIYNRLAMGMPLQIDATVRYATNNYTTPITVSQLHDGSPWNTYVHKGLPPTPIDSPGPLAIQAAAHPASTQYLFFVVKPCGNGEHAFASSYAQFLQEEQQYQTARTKRGGRSPANC